MSGSRLYPDRPYLAASVAVVRDGRVLLASRARPPLLGVWTLPGGLVEPGETLMEAALRELAQETGVRAEPIGFVAPVEVIGRDEAGRTRDHFVVCAHAARWLHGEGDPGEEALAIRWCAPDDLAGLHTTDGLDGIVRAALALAAAHSGR